MKPTPKEKAIELVNYYFNLLTSYSEVRNSVNRNEITKQCALLAIKQIIDSMVNKNDASTILDRSYYRKIRKEIQKL